jgi:hypothetical protein
MTLHVNAAHSGKPEGKLHHLLLHLMPRQCCFLPPWLDDSTDSHLTCFAQAITYIIEGGFQHYDSTGKAGLLMPGSVQLMTAGEECNCV